MLIFKFLKSFYNEYISVPRLSKVATQSATQSATQCAREPQCFIIGFKHRNNRLKEPQYSISAKQRSTKVKTAE